jgi:hypothetical protein
LLGSRGAGLDIIVALAVAVDVEHERRPTLRLRRIAGLVEHLGVDPAGNWAGAAEPQRVIGVVAELKVVGGKAGVDEAVLHRLGVEHRHLACRLFQRGNSLADGWSEPCLQNIGLSMPRPVAQSQSRPFSSNMELWLFALVSQSFLVAPIG